MKRKSRKKKINAIWKTHDKFAKALARGASKARIEQLMKAHSDAIRRNMDQK
jgi:hypothetical protein